MSRLGNTRPSGVSEHIEFCMLTAVERLAVGLKGSERPGPSSQDRSEKAYGHHDGLGIEEQVVSSSSEDDDASGCTWLSGIYEVGVSVTRS